MYDTILVFDFGGQYCHLIARSIREIGVYSEIVSYKTTAEEISNRKDITVKGIILSGGSKSVYEKNAPLLDRRILQMGIPVLGICYGHQLIAHMEGGDVRQAPKKEYGEANAYIDKPIDILEGLNKKTRVWMSHGDAVFSLPLDYEPLAHTPNTPVAAFRSKSRPIYGVQWHPEVFQTEKGQQVFRNFVKICKCKKDWKMRNFAKKAIAEVKRKAGGRRCIVALSGGVDSSVAAAIVGRAIGKNLTAIYVDTGLMREHETEEIRGQFGKTNIDFRIVDAQKIFLKSLKGISDPEKKRRIIGKVFAKVFEREARKVGADFLVQGTIYPDRVESGRAGNSATIKTHHNVGGMPKNVKFKGILEPLRDLYKDEVRKAGKELSLPDSIINRQPFPGPGLAVRIIGAVTRKKLEILRKADAILTEEIKNSKLDKGLWQYFAVLTNTKSVGVRGDSRFYGLVLAIRAVRSREAMTAEFAKLPWDALRKISSRIINEVPEVTRVVYDITDKPPATIEWE
ncbi:MAG: glutamine-hydrolyzing GMP synthase [Candidatus Micrarchaeia archaeon]